MPPSDFLRRTTDSSARPARRALCRRAQQTANIALTPRHLLHLFRFVFVQSPDGRRNILWATFAGKLLHIAHRKEDTVRGCDGPGHFHELPLGAAKRFLLR